jgi:hypothetical protein
MAILPVEYRKPGVGRTRTVATLAEGEAGWVPKKEIVFSQTWVAYVDPTAEFTLHPQAGTDVRVIRKQDGIHLILTGGSSGTWDQPHEDPPTDFVPIFHIEP